MISHALYSRLSSEVSLVGSRVYPKHRPQNVTYPAITYFRVSRVPVSAMVTDRPDVMYRIQVDVWAERYDDATKGALQVCAQVRSALQRWHGTAGGFEVTESFLNNEMDRTEQEDPNVHHVVLDFTVWAEE